MFLLHLLYHPSNQQISMFWFDYILLLILYFPREWNIFHSPDYRVSTKEWPPCPICFFYFIFLEISWNFQLSLSKNQQNYVIWYIIGVLSGQNYVIKGSFWIWSSINKYLAFPYIFSIIQERFIEILFFSFLLIKKCNNLNFSPKLCKITPNFKLILIDKVINHKFFTLTLNGLKALAPNQGNHLE